VTALLNLLDNAWKYSGERKVVTVRAYAAAGADGAALPAAPDNGSPPDGAVCIEVSDDGMGMTRRAARRVFEKFYQVDQRLSRRAGGCGLGLAIVKFIADAHGGEVSVRSQLGQGSTFTLRLPAAGSAAREGGC